MKESQRDSLLTLYSRSRFWLKLPGQVSSVITLQKAFKNKPEVGCKAPALLRGGGQRKNSCFHRQEGGSIAIQSLMKYSWCKQSFASQAPCLGALQQSPAVTGRCSCSAHWAQLTLLHVLEQGFVQPAPLSTCRGSGCGKLSLELDNPHEMTVTSSASQSWKALLFSEPNEEIAEYPRAAFDLWFPYSGMRLLNDLLKFFSNFILLIEKLWQRQSYKTASSALHCRCLFYSQMSRWVWGNKVSSASEWKAQKLNFKSSRLCYLVIK